MKHNALTEEQIAEAGLVEEGTYDFTIVKAAEKTSEKGNDMFELQLTVFDNEGKERSVRDWVMPLFPKKFKHLHDALGLLDLYAKGETKPENLEGKSGKLILKIGKPRTNSQGFEVRYNEVEDYVKRDNMQAAAKSHVEPPFDDSIPF